MTPEERLQAAKALLADPGPLGQSWLRAVCLLTRQALEHEVARRVEAAYPGAGNGPGTLQLIILRACVTPELAREVAWTWNGLSQACHHRGYELNPSVREVRGWILMVEVLLSGHDG